MIKLIIVDTTKDLTEIQLRNMGDNEEDMSLIVEGTTSREY